MTLAERPNEILDYYYQYVCANYPKNKNHNEGAHGQHANGSTFTPNLELRKPWEPVVGGRGFFYTGDTSPPAAQLTAQPVAQPQQTELSKLISPLYAAFKKTLNTLNLNIALKPDGKISISTENPPRNVIFELRNNIIHITKATPQSYAKNHTTNVGNYGTTTFTNFVPSILTKLTQYFTEPILEVV
jgi:hypothetical protein